MLVVMLSMPYKQNTVSIKTALNVVLKCLVFHYIALLGSLNALAALSNKNWSICFSDATIAALILKQMKFLLQLCTRQAIM